MGNGDMGVAIGGPPESLFFILCKNDFWKLKSEYDTSSPVPPGRLVLKAPSLKRASYRIEQDLYTATTTGNFKGRKSSLQFNAYSAATQNLLIIELSCLGIALELDISLDIYEGRGAAVETGSSGDIRWGTRAFLEDVDIPTAASVAWSFLNAPEESSDGKVLLTPEEPLTLVLAMDSLFKSLEHRKNAIDIVSSLTDTSAFADIRKAHEAWWAEYWAKSYVGIGDPLIEHQYYLSLYGLGSISRDPEFPPPIFGWTTTDNPLWNGDYHLNYNFQAPFYGLARANRLEQADPHDTPIIDFIPRAQWHCRELFGYEGLMYPVGIGPRGIETTYGSASYIQKGTRMAENGGLFFGQRTNGSLSLVNMAARWYCTYDNSYGEKIYPVVKMLALFWEQYITWDNGKDRYIIDNDSVHEGSGTDMNSCLSLALLRHTLTLALDLSDELNRDSDKRDSWVHILNRLSDYSYQKRKGKRVFRYTERGTAWWKNNTLGIHQIYPAGQIHWESDPDLLELSRNTISVMKRWNDHNGTNSFFPAAVRVGYDPRIILRKLRSYARHTRPNGFQRRNPHGIENFSTVHNTVNEMLCSAHTGVLRIFPVWPKERDAFFIDIRCHGAFLVSAELKDGIVVFVKIRSEGGRLCTIENPWPGDMVKLIGGAASLESFSGDLFTVKTNTGEEIILERDHLIH